MADAPAEQPRVGYPYMSAGTWGQIRARLRTSVPGSISSDWLQSVLSISEKNAGNISPQLRRLGLIDKAGVPQQPLVNNLREDDTYVEACREIIKSVYPEALLDAFPEPHEDQAGVAGWFRRNAGTGERMAEFQARFLAVLSSGTIPQPGERLRPAQKAIPSNPAKKVAPAKAPSKQAPSKGLRADAATGDARSRTPADSELPSVHIDIQVHIDSSASPEQVDAVFSSMARHLYGK